MRAIMRSKMSLWVVREYLGVRFWFCFALLLVAVILPLLASAQVHKDCLDQVPLTGSGSGVATAFDKLFDNVNDGNASFSCYLYIPASRARDAIESFRYGILYSDKARLDRVFRYPLRVIKSSSSGNSTKQDSVIVHDFQEWSTIQTTEMTKSQLQVIRCSWLGNVTLVGGKSFNPGFIIGDGLVFFGTSDTKDVRITSVDLMPITPEMLTRACTP